MPAPKLVPADVSTPVPQLPPPTHRRSLMELATDMFGRIVDLERMMVDENWLPRPWLVQNGPVIRDRKDGQVLLLRGWHSVIETTVGKSGDLKTYQTYLLDLAAAALKVASDVERFRGARADLPAEIDCPHCGVITASDMAAMTAVLKRTRPETDDEEEDDEE